MDTRSVLDPHIAELTLRGLLLGALITVVFMTANLYLGLKTGVTFSTSIPAAILSIGLLSLLGGGGLLESNIVQTQASAAGTLCNVILVIPGLVIVGHWQGFPFWQTTGICLIGGLLGIAYSIPLRRALVIRAGLPFPEGVAAAEVLQAGVRRDRGGLRALLGAAAVSGLVGLATTGFRLLAEEVHATFVAGPALFRVGTGFSLALFGVGYLVGIGACLALLVGVTIAWGAAVPLLTAFAGGSIGSPDAEAQAIWSSQVRLIGAGIIAVGAVWTVTTLISPIADSIRAAFAASRTDTGLDLPRVERDLPIAWIAGGAAVLTLPLAWLFGGFASDAGLSKLLPILIGVATLFAVLFGFLMASACGYLAGLLGSSSSPISGIGVLTTMLTALLIPLIVGREAGLEGDRFVIAFALMLASVIVTVASIANDNLQDLKTGQMVGATPWCQQVALITGVCVGAAVIAPLLTLLYQAYGFVGAMPREGMDPASVLPAPQATLMAQIAGGIVRDELPWRMVLLGGALGAVFVALETWLRRFDISFPALTVGIGVYLPLEVVTTIACGGLIGWLTERKIRVAGGPTDTYRETARRTGVLLASGLLVGESLVGVLLAIFNTLLGSGTSLVLSDPGSLLSPVGLGLVVFLAVAAGFYRIVVRVA